MKSKRTIAVAVIVLALACLSFAQTKAQTHKPAKIPRSLPVSGYMRKVGILYLQSYDDVSKACDGLVSDDAARERCGAATEISQRTWDSLEPMVDINVSESKVSGDPPTWRLLNHIGNS